MKFHNIFLINLECKIIILNFNKYSKCIKEKYLINIFKYQIMLTYNKMT